MKQKIETLLADINQGLVEREEVLKIALLTLLAGEHLVLIGPPGTAKSAIARRVAECLDYGDEERHFEYLLTKFSTPEEIFGPLSITELKADRFRRNTRGYLPTARVAFLDEIFKANSSILNSLLSILNERIFHNGSEPQRAPLLSLISASNELPVGVEELNALYDRFLVRTVVNPVSEDGRARLFETPAVDSAFNPSARISQTDVDALYYLALQVRIPADIADTVLDIWHQHQHMFREDRRELLSDRRLVKVLKLLRMSAATNGRDEVDLSDLLLLKNCLWNHVENMEKVRGLVIATLKRRSRLVPVERDKSAPNTATSADSDSTSHTKLEARFTAKAETKTKGFSGSGTASDPIRIASADDLQAIDDDDIRSKGFHFLQTHDIDCAHITSWPAFVFKGHYDGNGKTIRNLNVTDPGTLPRYAKSVIDGNSINTGPWLNRALLTTISAIGGVLIQGDRSRASCPIFNTIESTSIVTHLTLEGCSLADTVQGSHIENCKAVGAPLLGSASKQTKLSLCRVVGGSLIYGDATNSQIIRCQATGGALVNGKATETQVSYCQADGGALVNGEATETQLFNCQVTGNALVNGNTCRKTKISRCQVIDGAALVWGTASDTHIADCAVLMNWRQQPPSQNGETFLGFITSALSAGSVIERCFGAGNYSPESSLNFTHFGGITGKCENSTIRQSAVGPHTVDFRQGKRIVYEKRDATLTKNAAVDSASGIDDPDGLDGKTVAAARFTQRFFEDSLGWDFEKIWQWDPANSRPTLRFVGADALESPSSTANSANMEEAEDLLTRQFQANIWL